MASVTILSGVSSVHQEQSGPGFKPRINNSLQHGKTKSLTPTKTIVHPNRNTKTVPHTKFSAVSTLNHTDDPEKKKVRRYTKRAHLNDTSKENSQVSNSDNTNSVSNQTGELTSHIDLFNTTNSLSALLKQQDENGHSFNNDPKFVEAMNHTAEGKPLYTLKAAADAGENSQAVQIPTAQSMASVLFSSTTLEADRKMRQKGEEIERNRMDADLLHKLIFTDDLEFKRGHLDMLARITDDEYNMRRADIKPSESVIGNMIRRYINVPNHEVDREIWNALLFIGLHIEPNFRNYFMPHIIKVCHTSSPLQSYESRVPKEKFTNFINEKLPLLYEAFENKTPPISSMEDFVKHCIFVYNVHS